MTTKPRAALYLRLSKTTEASTSIERQEADLRARAEREGWAIAKEHVLVDDGLSGRKERAKATEALDLLRSGAVQVLMVWKLDRFGRRGAKDLAEIQGALDDAPGSRFVALRDGLDSDQRAGWHVVSGVLGGLAAAEAENISTRSKSSRAHLVTVGRWPGGRAPYGYRTTRNPDGPGRVLVQVDGEVAEVRRMVDAILVGDASANGLARDLTARGVPAPRSAYRAAALRRIEDPSAPDPKGLDRGAWQASTVRALLRGNAIAGYQTRDPERVGKGKRPDPAELDMVRDSDRMPLVVWDAIVTADELAALRRRFPPKKDRVSEHRGRPPRALLSGKKGLGRCGLCGGPLYMGTSGGVTSYRCARPGGGAVCMGVSIRSTATDAEVGEALLSVAGEWPVVEPVTLSEAAALDAERARVEAALDEITRQKRASSRAERKVLSEQEEALLERLDALAEQEPETRVEIRETGETFREAWERAGVPERRVILAGALDAVEITPKRVDGPRFDASRIVLHWRERGEDGAVEILSGDALREAIATDSTRRKVTPERRAEIVAERERREARETASA
ncbi:recombinase family protein [Demequina mangrovi]|uniref:Site-specific DNA recombinase n=1 Tax=Demequina mangrovi TaxID=1043493 RepID=A0A1H6YVU6_9MICO|nr:recombinase family protein [Demequina mangrovi]SEJ45351.1 Site-specific DNA recombinase [Demequina mangrovi]